MFRCADVTSEVVRALGRCTVPEGQVVRILVIDDASNDGSAESIEALSLPFVQVVRNPANLGRSRTRNTGGHLSQSGYLLFLDGDCIPADSRFLNTHMAAMEAGNDVSIGSVTGTGRGFWHRYQAEAAERRSRVASTVGPAHGATSQNFMIRQSAFAQLRGFDEGYLGYGFEDRDFFLRAEALGLRMAWTIDAAAIHADTLDLDTVCRKMREAGSGPAARFAAAHPDAYESLAYAALDATRHGWLRYVQPITSLAARCIVALVGRRLDSKFIPYVCRAAIVRLAVAASYLEGTCNRPDAARG